MSQILSYLVREPSENPKTAQAIFLLHGYGSDENDLFSFASELPSQCYIFSIRAPYTLPMSGYAWYDIHYGEDQSKWSNNEQALESIEKLKSTVVSIQEKYKLAHSRHSFIGFSQGTIMSYAFMAKYPEMIKNLIGLSGYINEAITTFSSETAAYKHIEVFASHGSSDQIIPLAWAQKTPNTLKKIALNPTFKEYRVGHGICPENFYDFRDWLTHKL